MDEPKETGQRWCIYCTKSTRELVGKVIKLTDEQKDFLCRWIEKGGNVVKK